MTQAEMPRGGLKGSEIPGVELPAAVIAEKVFAFRSLMIWCYHKNCEWHVGPDLSVCRH